ncbi:DMT family transporter [Geothrix sp. PMB-07]|uniref:DMT family transporter n=1 Tax=Geothrix sp. PMB-07 TaxID=3068640 RepID=UPI002740CBEE|nr:EamA family transporter [Geothrix sp. PMB-07]WLT31051.1 EamA family transporter [Geothrix sp. PMB-07]
MNNLTLYLVSVLIWGSTWIAITFQYGRVAPEVSVAYRFALAAGLLAGWSLLRRLKLRFTLREHGWMALQGALMFGLNYVCVYLAEQRIPSGLMAVIFSLMAILNLLGARVFFGTPVPGKALWGTALGVTGVGFICLPGAGTTMPGHGLRAGLALAVGGTVAASLSNLVSQRNQRQGIPVVQGNAVSMGYGALFVALYAWAAGRPFVFDSSLRYMGSLAFLAVFGSILAFGAYLTLVGRIGAGRAGYAMVAIPVVALVLSTALEGLRWHGWLLVGVLLCLLGNVLILPRAPQTAKGGTAESAI